MAARRLPSVRVKAFAKLNLSLRVLGIRPDGYHELRTVFQSIALHDTLTFRRISGPLRIACTDSACPANEQNIVSRAAELVWRHAGRPGTPKDLSVQIAKRIPMQAGLGGGSSDAAAAVRAIAALWRVKLTRDRLVEIAAALGADVPYFLDGGTALGAGRGDRLVTMPDVSAAWVILVFPPFGVSTKDAYAWWDENMVEPFQQPLDAGAPPCQIANDLQPIVAARHPEITRLAESLWRCGARQSSMSGSGSTVYGLFDRRASADRAARHVAALGHRVVVTRTIGRRDYSKMSRLAR